MTKNDFLRMLRGLPSDRTEMIESLTALIISASCDLAETEEEIDEDFRQLASILLETNESDLVRKAYEVNLIDE
jgi:hypothetical protein